MFGPSTPAATTGLESNSHANIPDGGTFLGGDSSDWTSGAEMWYLPAGPAFFQNIDNNSVSMTAEGVNVGGLDLLEYMAMDPLEGFNMEGTGFN